MHNINYSCTIIHVRSIRDQQSLTLTCIIQPSDSTIYIYSFTSSFLTTGPTDCIVYFNGLNFICWEPLPTDSNFNTFKFCSNLLDHWAHRLYCLLQYQILYQLHGTTGPTDSICFQYLQILSQLHLLGPLGPQTPFVKRPTSFVGNWAHRLYLIQ